MGKEYKYLVLDTETTSMKPWSKSGITDKDVKDYALSHPIVYDIGWTIINRKGDNLVKRSYLVAEVFGNFDLFQSAYYANKRPKYCESIIKGEIEVKTWNEIARILKLDMMQANYIGAFNSAFDFFRAIPFTERYISSLYSGNFTEWREKFTEILPKEKGKKTKRTKHSNNEWDFRGITLPLFDVYDMLCDKHSNNKSFKEFCVKNEKFSESKKYFLTNAETFYQYTFSALDFVEDHTALSDAIIEAKLLAKLLQKKAVKVGFDYFPFQKIGRADKYLEETRRE